MPISVNVVTGVGMVASRSHFAGEQQQDIGV